MAQKKINNLMLNRALISHNKETLKNKNDKCLACVKVVATKHRHELRVILFSIDKINVRLLMQ